MNTGVIGLGKLGIPMLAAHVAKGLNVKGFDANSETVAKLRNKELTIKEPGIKAIMDADTMWSDRFCNDIKDLYNHANVIFIVVPTLSLSDSSFDCSIVTNILREIIDLNQDGKGLDVVISSTINPGDCECLLELTANTKINLLYSPEFIALGNVLEDMLNPDIRLIGSDNPYAADRLQWIFEKIHNNNPVFHHLSHVEAEIVKISINSMLTLKISFANTIGAMVHTFTYGDMDKVKRTLKAIGDDSRINNAYLKFGNGFSGPCFPRDNKCLSYHLRRKGLSSHLPTAGDNVNTFILEYWTRHISQKISNIKNIVFVGLSYKQNSDYVEESFIVSLYHKIKSLDKEYFFIDNLVESYPNITKVTDLEFTKENTLFLINHGDEVVINTIRKTYNFIDLW
jgi:UDPglucose 6-dehydrogenase